MQPGSSTLAFQNKANALLEQQKDLNLGLSGLTATRDDWSCAAGPPKMNDEDLPGLRYGASLEIRPKLLVLPAARCPVWAQWPKPDEDRLQMLGIMPRGGQAQGQQGLKLRLVEREGAKRRENFGESLSRAMGCSASHADCGDRSDRSSRDSGVQSLEELQKFLRDVQACPVLLQAKVERKRKQSFGEHFMEEDPVLPPDVKEVIIRSTSKSSKVKEVIIPI
eukprot:s478_g14.t1